MRSAATLREWTRGFYTSHRTRAATLGFFEGEEEGAEGTAADPTQTEGEQPSGTGTGSGQLQKKPGDKGSSQGSGQGSRGKLFTQDELNSHMKKEREKYQATLEKLQREGLTPEMKQDLESKIQELQDQGKTAEQLAKEAQDRINKDWEKKYKKSTEEGAHWKNQYEAYRTQTEIMKAAHDEEAFNPSQIYEIIRASSRLQEVIGPDGKGTGEYVTRVKMKGQDEDGKPVELDLDPTAAIKRMKEMEVHYNLFRSGKSNGVGSYNAGGGSGQSGPPKDMAKYAEWRKKHGAAALRGTKS